MKKKNLTIASIIVLSTVQKEVLSRKHASRSVSNLTCKNGKGTRGNSCKGINVLGATGNYVRKIIRKCSADRHPVTATFYHKLQFYFTALVCPLGAHSEFVKAASAFLWQSWDILITDKGKFRELVLTRNRAGLLLLWPPASDTSPLGRWQGEA